MILFAFAERKPLLLNKRLGILFHFFKTQCYIPAVCRQIVRPKEVVADAKADAVIGSILLGHVPGMVPDVHLRVVKNKP